MTFARKIELQKEYEKWVEEISKESGYLIDGSSFVTVLTFLDDKELLVDPNIKLRRELLESAVFAMDKHGRNAVILDGMDEPI